MIKRRKDPTELIAGFIVVALVLLIASCQPMMEAKTFNKFTTGPKATFWDAVWGNLRVTPK